MRRSIWHRIIGHKWTLIKPKHRYCVICGTLQELQFYSNRTQEWIDVPTYTCPCCAGTGKLRDPYPDEMCEDYL